MAKIYKVGGCVRDQIMGLNTNDIDFTFVCENSDSVEEGWNEMVSWLKENKFEIFLETPECYTIRAKFPDSHMNAGMVADFVMARKEVGYYEGTRRPILELGTLYDDLERRDFTVNAIAMDDEGLMIDPFNGKEDIYNLILRTPLNPSVTFLDDPLRVFRAMRFSVTKNMAFDKELYNGFKNPKLLPKIKETVSQERIRTELEKMLKFDTAVGLKIIHRMEFHIPGFYELLVRDGMWLQPTFKQ